MWRTLCELLVKLCGLSVSKSISKWIPNPVGLRQEKLSHPAFDDVSVAYVNELPQTFDRLVPYCQECSACQAFVTVELPEGPIWPPWDWADALRVMVAFAESFLRAVRVVVGTASLWTRSRLS